MSYTFWCCTFQVNLRRDAWLRNTPGLNWATTAGGTLGLLLGAVSGGSRASSRSATASRRPTTISSPAILYASRLRTLVDWNAADNWIGALVERQREALFKGLCARLLARADSCHTGFSFTFQQVSVKSTMKSASTNCKPLSASLHYIYMYKSLACANVSQLNCVTRKREEEDGRNKFRNVPLR